MTVTVRKPEQYRIRNHTVYYTVLITYGLLDTEILAMELCGTTSFVSIKECRENIKIHAARHGITNPIILR